MAGSGTTQGFDASVFREAIRSTMIMALPNAVDERITFVFKEARTFPIHGPDQDPYDWTDTPTTDTPQSTLQVPAAVQWGLGSLADTPIGQFDTSKGVITLLDVDYDRVKEADEVLINGIHYTIDSVGPPIGLFDVTVYTLYITARG